MSAPLPDDPEAEQWEKLRREFLEMGFTETLATRLADVWADPKRIRWWLEQGCTWLQAVEIAT